MAEPPVVVRFHRSLYPASAVRAAAARFTGLGAVSVEEQPEDTLVSVTGVAEALRGRLSDELGNHVLHETVRARAVRPTGGGEGG